LARTDRVAANGLQLPLGKTYRRDTPQNHRSRWDRNEALAQDGVQQLGTEPALVVHTDRRRTCSRSGMIAFSLAAA